MQNRLSEIEKEAFTYNNEICKIIRDSTAKLSFDLNTYINSLQISDELKQEVRATGQSIDWDSSGIKITMSLTLNS